MTSFDILMYVTAFNAVFVILCFIYVSLKEKEYKIKRERYSNTVDSVRQEISIVKKHLNEQNKKNEDTTRLNKINTNENIKKQSVVLINELIPPIIESIQKIDESFSIFRENTNAKINKLESQINPSAKTEEKTFDKAYILRLHQSGKSSTEIASVFGIQKSEVDLAIRMNKEK